MHRVLAHTENHRKGVKNSGRLIQKKGRNKVRLESSFTENTKGEKRWKYKKNRD
jgi:hypothetical protein